MHQKYMAIRDKLRSSGQSADVKWHFYSLLDEILGTSPCANPVDVIEGGSFDMEDGDEMGKLLRTVTYRTVTLIKLS